MGFHLVLEGQRPTSVFEHREGITTTSLNDGAPGTLPLREFRFDSSGNFPTQSSVLECVSIVSEFLSGGVIKPSFV